MSNLPVHPTLLFPHLVFVLYLCVSISALQKRSSVLFFYITHICINIWCLFFSCRLTPSVYMTGSRRVIRPSWLSGSWRSFLYRSSVYSCHLFFPFSGFPLFLCIDHLGKSSYLSLLFFGTLHSAGISFPFSFAFASLLFSTICKASSDNHFVFLHLFF